MKKILIPSLFIFCFSFTAVVQAQPASNPAVCDDFNSAQIRNATLPFYSDLDASLKTANLNSESLNYLFRIFRTTNHTLNDLQKELVTETACIDQIKSTKQELNFVFLNGYAQLASRKRDFLLLEKYDAINTKFENTQNSLRSLAQNIKKFNDLLPCFVNLCLSR